MDYNDMYLKKRLRQIDSTLQYLTATVGYLLSIVRNQIIPPAGGNGSVIIRDEASDPEPPPTPSTVNAVLIFRNGAPSKYWDATNEEWI